MRRSLPTLTLFLLAVLGLGALMAVAFATDPRPAFTQRDSTATPVMAANASVERQLYNDVATTVSAAATVTVGNMWAVPSDGEIDSVHVAYSEDSETSWTVNIYQNAVTTPILYFALNEDDDTSGTLAESHYCDPGDAEFSAGDYLTAKITAGASDVVGLEDVSILVLMRAGYWESDAIAGSTEYLVQIGPHNDTYAEDFSGYDEDSGLVFIEGSALTRSSTALSAALAAGFRIQAQP